MNEGFYIAGAVALFATLMTVVSTRAVHALLYLIASMLALAVAFFTLGAPFAAALEVIVYAGAIMVMFIFVVMLLNLGDEAAARERGWLSPGAWVGPGILAAVLLAEVLWLVFAAGTGQHPLPGKVVGAKAVGMALYGPYLLMVEIASMMLTAGLIGAYHLTRDSAHRPRADIEEETTTHSAEVG